MPSPAQLSFSTSPPSYGSLFPPDFPKSLQTSPVPYTFTFPARALNLTVQDILGCVSPEISTRTSCSCQCAAAHPIALAIPTSGGHRLCRPPLSLSGRKRRGIRLKGFPVVSLRSLAHLPRPAEIPQGIIELAGHVHNFSPNGFFEIVPDHFNHGLLRTP